MATLQVRLSDLITAIGTDIKQLRTWITGSSSGDLTGLTTTDKTSVVAAINEVKAGASGAPPDATETVKGVAELATQVETNAGTDDARIVTPLKLQTRMAAYAQPLDSDLTAIAALTTTTFGRALLGLADGAGLAGQVAAATETQAGVAEVATQTETNTGTDDARMVTPLKLQTRMAAYAQPLDSDLTAIAALTTTAYGRGLLALADQAALTAALAAATTALPGIVELATTAESQTGTDTVRASTPAGVKAAIDQRIDNSALGTSTTNAPSANAVKTYADALIGANDAMVFKGVIDASTNPNYPASNRGDTYRISVAGKIGGASGPNVEVGDILIALTDGTASGTQATVGAQWNIVQSNIDGAVTGPASSTSTDLATYSGTTGKVIQDSGVQISTDGTLATNNNTKVPTEGAIRTYLGANYYTQAQLGNPDTDLVALYTTAKA